MIFVAMFSNNFKNNVLKYVHVNIKITLRLIETFKLTIYNTKHTNNTKIPLQKYSFFVKSIFSKTRH